MWFIGIVVAIGIAIVVALAIKEDAEWQKFKADHGCIVVGNIDGSAGLGMSYDGKLVTTYISGKVLWKCDDGRIYGRDE